jgi:Flp pilus assembly protein TadB
MLVDDESDLIYHIVCSRDRPNGAPHSSLKLLDSFWFTKDELNPRSHDLPTQHENIFRRSGEFSRDASRFADQIEGHKQSLLDSDWPHALAEGIEYIDQLYCAADWLALRYQKATLSALRSIHVLAFIMGFMFILYSDLSPLLLYLALFIVAFVFASIVQRVAHRNGWHRKYLDYRALAEGLRVQFYWAAAGIVSPHVSKFPHDSFLQLQDPEIGWIRNVMRVAGTRVSAAPQTDDTNLDATIERWIGSDTNGQLGYFAKKTRDVLRRKRITERLGKASLLSGVAVVFVFLIARDALPVEVRALLMIAMGTLLLIYAIRHSYSSSIAEKELLRQFEFMLRVFRDSHRRIESASTAQEKRQILLALGGSALDEQAGWILTHRERSIDSAELMEIGS